MLERHAGRPGPSPGPTSQPWKAAGITALVLACLAILFLHDPAGSTLYPRCPFHTLTGFHCPGCGTLRALHQLLHGNLAAAFGLNPLGVLLFPFLGYGLLCTIVRRANGRRLPTVFIPAVWIWVLLGVILAFWVLRNVPFYPFSWIAP
jgi:hypothetical protein